MENFLEGGVPELELVKTDITELARKEQEYKESDRSLKAKQKELEIQRKRVDEKINTSIKKARASLEKGYDDQLATADRAIRDAETKRKNAKAAAVNLRMQRENSSLVDENKVLEAEMAERFKTENVPAICRNRLYYALFAPKQQSDFLICAAAVVLFAGLIPFIVTRFVPEGFTTVLVWILIVVFFAALYFLISAWTKKGERNNVILSMRESMIRISDNKKFIKKRNKNIKADPDESQYNLSSYDETLSEAREEHDRITAEKEAAIRKFEEEESVSIREQLENEKLPVFTELEKEIDQMQEDLQVRTEAYQEAAKKVEEYTGYLGDKNVRTDKIDELISLIKEEKATTIQEALDVQKGK